jgi:hypothetical protein
MNIDIFNKINDLKHKCMKYYGFESEDDYNKFCDLNVCLHRILPEIFNNMEIECQLYGSKCVIFKNKLEKLIFYSKIYSIIDEYLALFIKTHEGQKYISLLNASGDNILMLSTFGSLSTLKLIATYCDINHQNYDGLTATMYSCIINAPIEHIKYLVNLENNNLKLTSNKGHSINYYISKYSNSEIITYMNTLFNIY